MRRLRRFAALPPADRRLTVEAAAWLTVALGLLALLPFRWVAARFGTPTGSDRVWNATASSTDLRQQALAQRVGRAVERTARHLPVTARCLPQAIAAKAMLHRRGIAATMHFGIRLSDRPDTGRMTAHVPVGRVAAHAPVGRMAAHAWVTAGGAGVVGLRGSAEFAVIARFTHEATAGTVPDEAVPARPAR